jgi:hypothetical protein
MSRLYCCFVIISQPLGTKLTLGQPSKPLLDTTGSLVISNCHYWGIIIVTVQVPISCLILLKNPPFLKMSEDA